MNVRTLLLVLPTTLLLLAGCAGAQANTREEAATTSQQQGMQAQGMCPMRVQGTKVEASNTDNGAALTFTTTGDVAELRQRVSAMAKMHNAHHGGAGAAAGCPCPMRQEQAQGCPCPKHGAGHGAGPGQGGSGCPACPMQGEGQARACPCPKHGEGGKGMKQGMRMPASRVTTEEVEGGIRMVFTPVEEAQLDTLRESVRHHAERMSTGQCPMMRTSQKHGG